MAHFFANIYFVTKFRKSLLILLFLIYHQVSAQVIFVDSSRASSGVGTSWATAYKTLKEATITANANNSITEIHIARGTYFPTTNTNRDSTFLIARGNIRLYGGYPSGGGTRNIATNPTILSGNIGSITDSTDNSHHVVVIAGVSAVSDSIIIDGLIIQWGCARFNGTANVSYNAVNIGRDNAGGLAIFSVQNGNKTSIQNCVIRGNHAADGGAGIYISSSSPQIVNCLFNGNYANYGGASVNLNSTPRYINCTFGGNHDNNGGGGMRNSSSNTVLINCIMYGNDGGISNNSSTPVVTYSLLQGFTATTNGNINGNTTNPLFTAPIAAGNTNIRGDYQLQACSPVINLASNAIIPAAITTDLLGNLRIEATTADMGAYEYQSLPAATSPQTFCGSYTVANLSATGTSIKWYNVSSGGTALAAGTTLSTGIYYATQTVSGCESPRIAVTVTVNNIPAAPAATNPQAFCSSATVASLTATGTAIKWYNVSSGGTELAAGTAISTGTYYASQTVNSCESPRTTVAVVINSTIRYVRQGASGSGVSWADASGDLQLMINQACPNTEIWVAQGTYKPNRPADNPGTPNATSRDNAFVMNADVKIYGGFQNSGNPTMAQRNWTSYPTILSGDIGIVGDSTDNCYHVVISSSDVGIAELDGFTITAGNANVTSSIYVNGYIIYRHYGGGMTNVSSSPTVSNCTFLNNTASNGGGGMYNAYASPTVNNCTFSGNTASSVSNGGGMYNDYASPTMNNCTFSGNIANTNGGGIFNYFASPTVNNCTFSGNTANTSGGGISNVSSPPIVSNCTFSGNTANISGGGMYNVSSSPIVSNCIFSGNTANTSGGGVYNTGTSSITITNVTISGNTAPNGAEWYNNGGTPVLRNSIIWGNGVTVAGGSFNRQYSLIQGQNGIGTCNIVGTTDPLFVNPSIGDYRLQPCSPAINAGLNSAIPTGITTDLDSNPRIYETTVDMGAYEYQSNPLILHVKPTASGTGDGSSWANASGDLQLMINQACPNSEIWVAQGTFYPNRPANNLNIINTTSRDNAFVLKPNVKIYGGFAPTGTPTLAQRNWETFPTILSGDIGTSGSAADNCYHVVISSGNVGTAELDGFTITGGNANLNTTLTVNGNTISRQQGAGMYNIYSSPLVANCTFLLNSANAAGGGMYNTNSSTPTVINCTFSGNTSMSNGGGIYNISSSPMVENCTFSGNTATIFGGGMYNSNSSNPQVSNSLFSGNTANSNGGGVFNTTSSSPTIINVTIGGNTAPGGAEWHNINGTPIIRNSIIWGNGVTIAGGSFNLQYCLVQGQDGSGTGNIAGTTNPLFVNPGSGDYRLLPCSPAINTGNNASIPSGITTDLDGNPRIAASRVDMGAYENRGFSLHHTANSMLVSNGNCQTPDGWRHYYYNDGVENKVFISIHPDGQNLGTVTASTRLNEHYGTTSILLTDPYQVVPFHIPFNRSWILAASSAFANPVGVRFYFSDRDSMDLAQLVPIDSLEELKAYKVNGNNIWDVNSTGYRRNLHGTVADTNTYIFGTFQNIRYAEFKVKSFSTGTLGFYDNTLPLDLLSFTGSAIGDKTCLQWHTVNEQDVSHFGIERSLDARKWKTLQYTSALNGIEQQYDAWDNTPSKGINYYRLKMTDYDGTYKYSKVVEISFGQEELHTPQYLIYPNPNNGTFHVIAQGITQDETQMFLIDGLGRMVQNQLLQNGDNLIQTKGLAGGMYYLKIENKQSSTSYKVAIEQ